MKKEKPIIFSGPMVQAILNTKPGVWPAEPIDPSRPYKCMTRRVLVPQPDMEEGDIHDHTRFPISVDSDMRGFWGVLPNGEDHRWGKIPDVRTLLWVRETWMQTDCFGSQNGYLYKADGDKNRIAFEGYGIKEKWKPSIFMPREASRLTLEVKDVRVERLWKITPYDACCEGILVELPPALQGSQEYPEGFDKWSKDRRDKWFKSIARANYIAECDVMEKLVQGFHDLWDKLNAKRGYPWDSNPWVYVISFMRVE
jgi:hypothetical protein